MIISTNQYLSYLINIPVLSLPIESTLTWLSMQGQYSAQPKGFWWCRNNYYLCKVGFNHLSFFPDVSKYSCHDSLSIWQLFLFSTTSVQLLPGGSIMEQLLPDGISAQLLPSGSKVTQSSVASPGRKKKNTLLQTAYSSPLPRSSRIIFRLARIYLDHIPSVLLRVSAHCCRG